MEAVVADELGTHRIWLARQARRLVEIGHGVELAAVADEGVEGAPRGFRARVEALRTAESRQGPADDLDAAKAQASVGVSRTS